MGVSLPPSPAILDLVLSSTSQTKGFFTSSAFFHFISSNIFISRGVSSPNYCNWLVRICFTIILITLWGLAMEIIRGVDAFLFFSKD